MKAAKNTSCATVVQQITSEDAAVTHAFYVLKGWNDVYYLSSKPPGLHKGSTMNNGKSTFQGKCK